MLENLRIKFHALKLKYRSTSAHEDRMPVNPYAKPLPIAKSKINPYSTDYGSQRTQEPVLAKIMRIFGRGRASRDIGPYIPGMVEIVPVNAGPTFVDDMRRLFAEDMMFVASQVHLPKRQERKMSSEEIVKACERLRW